MDTYIIPTIKKIFEEIERQINLDLKKYQITLTQARIILYLHHKENKSSTQKEIELFLNVSHPTTVTIIKSMESKGIVKCNFNSDDKRMKIVELKWLNHEFIDNFFTNAKNMEIKILQGFSYQERDLFKSFLQRVIKNIS